jgi:hypothetical protein
LEDDILIVAGTFDKRMPLPIFALPPPMTVAAPTISMRLWRHWRTECREKSGIQEVRRIEQTLRQISEGTFRHAESRFTARQTDIA